MSDHRHRLLGDGPTVTYILDDEQRARVEALNEARFIVARRKADGSEKVNILDVVALARFILTGEDPWQPRSADDDNVLPPARFDVIRGDEGADQ